MWKNDSETICIQVNMTGIKDCQNDDIDAEIVNIERRNLTECQKGFEKEVEQEIENQRNNLTTALSVPRS